MSQSCDVDWVSHCADNLSVSDDCAVVGGRGIFSGPADVFLMIC